ncbi:MAG: HDOD domain-containing protein [Clostridiales Family XIII bacterium]|jgi:EAL and modified HD-GYP domain-containing signal transduction protein|nr:HDOD domain-containing protein [Clostridiales Family XIII bacterium]
MESFVARQPIFDKQNEVYAYELLYRKDRVKNAYDETVDADQASTRTIINGFVEIGLEKLTNGRKAFVNFTEKLLLDNIPALLPSQFLVVEILENIKPTPEVLSACENLKRAGFNIALDDFIICDENLAFLDYADIIKVDFITTSLEDIVGFVKYLREKQRHRAQPLQLLAEKIENDEMYDIAVRIGFHYFQGYFFSKPVIVAGRGINPMAINRLRIMQISMKPDFEFRELADVIRQDVALSFRLLKLVNSAYFAFSTAVSNIQQALVILGSIEVKKWAALMCLMEVNPDKTVEITRMSLVRARFLELLAPKVGKAAASEDLYLMGMFSLMDVMMESPMEEILAQMNLGEAVTQPLIEKSGDFYDMLRIIERYERGEFDAAVEQAEPFGLGEVDLMRSYVEALQWTSLLGI